MFKKENDGELVKEVAADPRSSTVPTLGKLLLGKSVGKVKNKPGKKGRKKRTSKPLPLLKGQRKISEVLDTPRSSRSVPGLDETSVGGVEKESLDEPQTDKTP